MSKMSNLTDLFVARDKFVVSTANASAAKIFYIGNNFKRWFLDKVENNAGRNIRAATIRKSLDDILPFDYSGVEEKYETRLAELFLLLQTQKNDEDQGPGVGWLECFYVIDASGEFRIVGATWIRERGGWMVIATLIHEPFLYSEDYKDYRDFDGRPL